MKNFLASLQDFFEHIFSSHRRRSAAKPQTARRARSRAARKPQNRAGELWTRFVRFVSALDRKILLAGGGGAVVIVIAIILVATLGDAPQETAETQPTDAEIEVEATEQPTTVSTISVEAHIDGAVVSEDGTEEQAIEDEQSEEAEETEQESATIDPKTVDASTVYLKLGDDDPLVAPVQERLMELGYMDYDMTTEHYGPLTQTAVIYFQRRHALETDGAIGAQTYELLFSDSAKKYAMTEGADGDDVAALQNRLYELGYIESVTSYYGSDTVSAVKRFQELNNLTQDGSVGAQTLEILYSDDVHANYLQYGSNSDTVKKCQERLKKLGYLTTDADGNYGPDTVNAVKRFQERNGLIADGFLGSSTKTLLLSSDALANALVLGVSGSDVENVQKQLKKLGYMSSVTGYYGDATESAVIAFQKRNGLSADGKIGSQTMNKLFSSSAKKAASSSSSSSSSSNKKPSSSGSSSSSNKKDESTNKVPNEKSVAALLKVAKSKLGCKYVTGAKGPNTFDCSGFVYWCLKQIGVKQSYLTSAGWAKNTKYPKVTSLSKVKAGDIICFKGHVGIAMGGGKMIDAGTSDGGVRTTSLSLAYWKNTFICAFRVL